MIIGNIISKVVSWYVEILDVSFNAIGEGEDWAKVKAKVANFFK